MHSASTANTMVQKYNSLFTFEFSATVAEQLLTPDYQLLSQSENILASKNISTSSLYAHLLFNRFPFLLRNSKLETTSTAQDPDYVAYHNHREFIAGQAAETAGENNTFTTLNAFHNCDSIVFWWSLNLKPVPVLGIDYLVLVLCDCGVDGWCIKESFPEFCVCVILFDAGFPECDQTKST